MADDQVVPAALSERHKSLGVVAVVRRGYVWHVLDCSCGWGSPLCETASKCHELHAGHVAAAAVAEGPA